MAEIQSAEELAEKRGRGTEDERQRDRRDRGRATERWREDERVSSLLV